MEYQKINLLDNAPNQPSKSGTKNQIKVNDDSCGTYNTNSQIKFKTLLLKLSLCYYSDACILLSGAITIIGTGYDAATRQADEKNKEELKIVRYSDCMSEININ